jgi:hypothetical protein
MRHLCSIGNCFLPRALECCLSGRQSTQPGNSANRGSWLRLLDILWSGKKARLGLTLSASAAGGLSDRRNPAGDRREIDPRAGLAAGRCGGKLVRGDALGARRPRLPRNNPEAGS